MRKYVMLGSIALASILFVGCEESMMDQKADAIRTNADATAEAVEESAEARADAIEDVGEARADAVEKMDDADTVIVVPATP